MPQSRKHMLSYNMLNTKCVQTDEVYPITRTDPLELIKSDNEIIKLLKIL